MKLYLWPFGSGYGGEREDMRWKSVSNQYLVWKYYHPTKIQ